MKSLYCQVDIDYFKPTTAHIQSSATLNEEGDGNNDRKLITKYRKDKIMKAREIQIIPTGEKGSEGFNEAIIILDGGKGQLIDSFTIAPSANIHFDFEIKVETTVKTAIRMWKNNDELFEVSLGYAAFIK